ncbi:MAG: TIGR03435 family protein [Edaphobacter sp.]
MKRLTLSTLTLLLLMNSSTWGSMGQGARSEVPQTSQLDAKPMSADADPSFEVATIRPSNPDHPIDGTPIGHRTVFAGVTMRFLMTFAYGVHDKQIVGAPNWWDSQPFDIEGLSDIPGNPSLPQMKTMLQKLMADRFQMKFHREKREISAYVLTVGKNGAKLDKSMSDKDTVPSLLGRPSIGMKGRNLTMVVFADLLQSGILDRPVVDQTGLQGRYDFLLRWTPDESQFTQVGGRFPPPTEGADGPPGLFTAIQEQLGLKLNAEKTAVDVLVIDHVEKPSQN